MDTADSSDVHGPERDQRAVKNSLCSGGVNCVTFITEGVDSRSNNCEK